MHPVSCTNAHQGVTDLVNYRLAGNITFLRNKRILNLCFNLRSYGFPVEVTFNSFQPLTIFAKNSILRCFASFLTILCYRILESIETIGHTTDLK